MNPSDSIIARTSCERVRQQPAQLIHLHNGMVIVLTAHALACYRNRAAVDDVLGNGLLSLAELADGCEIRFDNDACITTHSAGYVGLVDGKALLIAPFKVRLYPNNHDGLRGLNCLAELELPSIDVI
jgi:hypothetical protein